MSARVLARIGPNIPWGVPESPAERATHSALAAVEDLDAAVWCADSPEEILRVRAMVESLIKRLVVTSSVALTMAEHFGERP